MLRGALRFCADPCLLGRGLSTRKGGSTLGKVEGTGGYRGPRVPPNSGCVTLRTLDRDGKTGSAGRRGQACLLELVEPGQVSGFQGCLSQVANPRSVCASAYHQNSREPG